MDIVGVNLPLWVIFLIGIILVIVAWKFIKFALKILLVIIILLVILIGLDALGFFDTIQNLISATISCPLY